MSGFRISDCDEFGRSQIFACIRCKEEFKTRQGLLAHKLKHRF